MNPTTTPTVSGTPTPYMSGQTTTATNPVDYYNDPSLTAAGQQVQNTQQAAATAQEGQATLPAMLQTALSQKLTDNNPIIANRTADLTKYLSVLGNPEGIVDPANNNGVIFSPDQQRQLIADREAAAAAPLNADNLVIGLQNLGMSNVISSTAAAFAKQVQGLIDTAQIASNNYDRLYQTINSKAQIALSANQLAEEMRHNQASEALARQEFMTSVDYNRPIVMNQIKQDAQKGVTWGSLLANYGDNPYITPQDILNIYNQVNYYKRPADVTTQQMNQYTLNPGQPSAQAGIRKTLGINFGSSPTSGSSASTKPSLDQIANQNTQ